jgi:myo-inositol-1(or 4)-monophosphatase
MEQLMDKAIEAIIGLGAFVREERKKLKIDVKGFANFVTNIDIEVQDRLKERLGALAPDAVFLSEESPDVDWDAGRPCWIVDPIDGTTNLIHGYPHVAISVAWFDGEDRFGIVYNPFDGELYTAARGKGAFLNGEPIRVSDSRRMEQTIIGFGLPYNRDRARVMFRAAEKVFATCQDMKRKGAAALDLCYVAAGRLDGYFEVDLNVWDFAAGCVILEEAGGEVSDWLGRRIGPHTRKADLLSSNGKIHSLLLSLVQSTIE